MDGLPTPEQIIDKVHQAALDGEELVKFALEDRTEIERAGDFLAALQDGGPIFLADSVASVLEERGINLPDVDRAVALLIEASQAVGIAELATALRALSLVDA